MSELKKPLTRDWVLGTMRSKVWYGIDTVTGAFSWSKSVDNIARELGLNPVRVNHEITKAFTPSCLSKVHDDQPLLGALHDIGITPYIWTAGDMDWQKTKFINSGASMYVDESRYYCSNANKLIALSQLTPLISKKTNKIIVVDDKEDNLQGVKRLAKEYEKKGIQISDFHMDLNSPQKDATAFYEWLMQKKQEISNEPIELILDYDGVVANTDSVLFGPAVDNLWSLLSKQ